MANCNQVADFKSSQMCVLSHYECYEMIQDCNIEPTHQSSKEGVAVCYCKSCPHPLLDHGAVDEMTALCVLCQKCSLSKQDLGNKFSL